MRQQLAEADAHVAVKEIVPDIEADEGCAAFTAGGHGGRQPGE